MKLVRHKEFSLVQPKYSSGFIYKAVDIETGKKYKQAKINYNSTTMEVKKFLGFVIDIEVHGRLDGITSIECIDSKGESDTYTGVCIDELRLTRIK